MKINAFFRDRLNAPFHDPRKSWGAINHKTGDVFLRVGIWSLDEFRRGRFRAEILKPEWSRDFGQKERYSQVEAINGGAPGYIVKVERDVHGKLKIHDEGTVLLIERIVEQAGITYAEAYEINVNDLFHSTRSIDAVSNEIDEIIRGTRSATTRKALVDARIGQGQFRQEVLRLWDYKCAVTGTSTVAAIRASHIKSWQESSNEERLDSFNGLPLIATLDALFDIGLISFDHSGTIMISDTISTADRKRLGVTPRMKLAKTNRRTEGYLIHHRGAFFGT